VLFEWRVRSAGGPLLAAFAADVDWLGTQGVTVTRYNLAQKPQAFVSNPLVQQTLQRESDACLPLVLVNGEIATRGAYPRRFRGGTTISG
jgi:hypothetical protein